MVFLDRCENCGEFIRFQSFFLDTRTGEKISTLVCSGKCLVSLGLA